jgi:hypothetical protein
MFAWLVTTLRPLAGNDGTGVDAQAAGVTVILDRP